MSAPLERLVTITLSIDDAEDLRADLMQRPHDELWSDRVLDELVPAIESWKRPDPPEVSRVSHRVAWEGAETALCGAPGRLRTYQRPTDRPICPTCDLLAAALGWSARLPLNTQHGSRSRSARRCPNCLGMGKVIPEYPAPGVTCPVCNGSGDLNHHAPEPQSLRA